MSLQWYQWLQFALELGAMGTGLYTLWLCFLDCWEATREWLAKYNAEGDKYGERD